jgi:hypothetical protein
MPHQGTRFIFARNQQIGSRSMISADPIPPSKNDLERNPELIGARHL